MTMTSLDHVTSSVTWPFESQWAIAYWWSTGTKSVSPAVFEILGHKHIGVTTLTFQGHVRSSITWPFDSQLAISYRCSIGTKSVYPAVFQIMIPKYIWVMTLTFLGHVTSSVTWPFESQYHVTASDHSTRHRLLPIYWRCFITKPVSSPSWDNGHQTYRCHDLDFSDHVTSSVTWLLDSRWSISYRWSFGTKSLSLTVSEIFRLKHHVLIGTMLNRHCARAITWYVLYSLFKIWVHISISHHHFA